MQHLTSEPVEDYRLTRRHLIMLGAFNLAGLMVPRVRDADAAFENDLASLSRLPRTPQREKPLLVFRDFAADADVEVQRHVQREVSQRRELLTALKKKTGFEKRVRMRVEETAVRLRFVPQQQQGAAAAYHRYCLAVTDFLFEMGGKKNIFAAISSPTRSYPPLSGGGVCAFLVHRLAKDYQAVCRFIAESGRSVRYKVSGAIFSNHVGAVDLQIEMLAAGRFKLTRSPFTIWQNHTNGVSTLMAVPVEESLHYWLGAATDRQIEASMQKDPPQSLAAAKRLGEDWMAIEESVVGGLVALVLDRYCAKHRMTLPVSVGKDMHTAISTLSQYRYRAQGVRLVRDLGFQETLSMYLDSPAGFRDRLIRSAEA